METSSVLLLVVLVTCSVWTVHGRSFEVNINDHEEVDVDVSVGNGRPPGLCWACKWALNKVKKFAGPNATAEGLKTKLLSICDEIGILKPLCRKFVKKHLSELIEELTTTDDVRTICVNTRACKPKELLDLQFFSRYEDPQIAIREYS